MGHDKKTGDAYLNLVPRKNAKAETMPRMATEATSSVGLIPPCAWGIGVAVDADFGAGSGVGVNTAAL